ncbi:hypothetical protein BD289DRAFT_288492 [Coniella lustricola]|uniref:Uncharacterized protein n=1 Tax=Coniella lustricola TaxID=2025994 RepID=A0A2T3A5H1_9PEZI|nr:hypothetical protein BD289DRAFT_288492 [Coniella lustricola]
MACCVDLLRPTITYCIFRHKILSHVQHYFTTLLHDGSPSVYHVYPSTVHSACECPCDLWRAVHQMLQTLSYIDDTLVAIRVTMVYSRRAPRSMFRLFCPINGRFKARCNCRQKNWIDWKMHRSFHRKLDVPGTGHQNKRLRVIQYTVVLSIPKRRARANNPNHPFNRRRGATAHPSEIRHLSPYGLVSYYVRSTPWIHSK